jgi:cytidine deaminase
METPNPAEGAPAIAAPYYPELVLCLCAAVGTDTSVVSEALALELRSVGYEPMSIRLSSLMAEIPGLEYLSDIKAEDERIGESMKAGNEIRRIIGHADAVVRLALSTIHSVRASLNESEDDEVPAERHCFIITSLKRAEEFETLRKLFGQRVLLISVYEPKDQRTENLCRKIASSKNSSDPEAHKDIAEKLIDTDQKERTNVLGQRLEDVFQHADVFLKAGQTLREDARRFIQLLFQAPYITPTVDELLMFQARATAQRSADLSRQVGAVIATKTGEILATGCNEVPRAGGGVIWDDVAGTERDYRDYKIGQDPTAGAKKEIVAELEADEDAVRFDAFVGIAPSRFFDLFEMVKRKDSQGYSLKATAPNDGPKGVTPGSLVAELESPYLGSIANADWSKLAGLQRAEDSDEASQPSLGGDEKG